MVSREFRKRLLAASAIALVAAQAGAQTTTYTYDALGRVTSASDSHGPIVKYDYDKAGNRIRLGNGAAFQEFAAIFTASSTAQGTSGLQGASGMRDNAYVAASSIHITGADTSAWVRADLGATKNVNHIKIAAANNPALGGTAALLNGAIVEYSTDGASWQAGPTISGMVAGTPAVVTLGGVQARYVRIRRPAAGPLALGDFMLFSSAVESASQLVAVDDAATTTMGVAASVPVLANDYAISGGAPVISSFGQGAKGTVAQSGSNLVYTPVTGFTGQDGFAYTISNGSGEVVGGSVRITVNGVPGNTNPVAVADPVSTTSGQAKTFSPLQNDTDADGDTLSIQSLTTPSHGAADLNPDGSVTYTPAPGYLGNDSFQYVLSDGRGGTATGTVNVTVTSSLELKVIDPANYASKVVISGLSYEVSTAVYANNRTNVYVDSPLSSGKHYWETRLSCGYIAAGVTNDIVNEQAQGGYSSYNAGVMTQTGTLWPAANVSSQAPRVPGAVGMIVGYALDADAKSLRIYQNNTLQGTIALPINGPYFAHSGIRHLDTPMAGQSCANLVHRAEFLLAGSTIYAPPAGYDVLGATPNTAPVAVDDSRQTGADTPVTLDPTSNDTDADGDTLSVTAVGGATNGQVVRGGAKSVTYTPNPGFSGTDTFSYTVSDGRGGSDTGSVSIIVSAAPPIANNVATSVDYNSTNNSIPLNITGSATSVAVAAPPTKGAASANGTAISYTPNTDYIGPDSLTYTAMNAAGASAPATINITVAGPPAPTAGSATLSIGYNTPGSTALPVSGAYTSLAVQQQPAKGSVSFSGLNVTYTPGSGQYGADSFTYVATGPGGASTPGTVNVTIATPAAPTAANATLNVPYNTASSLALPASGVYTSLALDAAPAKGQVTISGANATYTPTAGQTGSDSFTYTATGPGGTSAPASVSVTIANPAPPSVANAVIGVGYQSSAGKYLTVTGLYDSLTVSQSPSKGSVSLSGLLATYSAGAGQTGSDSFKVTATGPGGTSAPATISVSIGAPPLPPAPTVSGTSFSVAYNGSQSVSLPVSGNWSSLSVSSSPSKGSVSISGSTATYTHTSSQSGSDSFQFKASGPGGTSSPATVSVSIAAPPNRAPVANPVVAYIDGVPLGTLASTSVNDGGSDPDGDPLTITNVTLTSGGANAAATISGRTISFTGIRLGTTTANYTVRDPGGLTATGTITINRTYEP